MINNCLGILLSGLISIVIIICGNLKISIGDDNINEVYSKKNY